MTSVLNAADRSARNLLAFPAQSNFSGVQHPLDLVDEAHQAGWDVLVDAAEFAPTNRTLGLVMALAVTIITGSGIHGPLPRMICLICLTLMWLEAVLGLCLGCELYRVMVRRGWRAESDAFEICADGACELDVTR